ncbi:MULTISPECIES: hypothetical protein [Corynebacterium]|nr:MULTISPECIES: hypothetical protein [Corynebacterium]
MTVQPDHASRTGFHVEHHAFGERESKTTGRKALLDECMRHLDPQLVAKYAERNDSIIAAETEKNLAFVNDGDGGFNLCMDSSDVVHYAEWRNLQIDRAPRDNQNEYSTFIVYAPISLLREIPNVYYRRDENGDIKYDEDGEPLMRSRSVAKDPQAVNQYFQDVLEYFGMVLPGGQQAIHGFALNFDESRPHIHIFADNFGPSSKFPGMLQSAFSKTWSQHRDLRYSEDHPNKNKRGKVISGRVKVAGLQKQMKEFMRDKGYDIEMENSPRAGSGLSKDEYMALQEAWSDIELHTERNMQRERELDSASADLEDTGASLKTRAADLDKRESSLQAQSQSLHTQQRQAAMALALLLQLIVKRQREFEEESKAYMAKRKAQNRKTRDQARETGHKKGYASGYYKGVKDGKPDGHAIGEEEGFWRGREEGFTTGYDDAYTDAYVNAYDRAHKRYSKAFQKAWKELEQQRKAYIRDFEKIIEGVRDYADQKQIEAETKVYRDELVRPKRLSWSPAPEEHRVDPYALKPDPDVNRPSARDMGE